MYVCTLSPCGTSAVPRFGHRCRGMGSKIATTTSLPLQGLARNISRDLRRGLPGWGWDYMLLILIIMLNMVNMDNMGLLMGLIHMVS